MKSLSLIQNLTCAMELSFFEPYRFSFEMNVTPPANLDYVNYSNQSSLFV